MHRSVRFLTRYERVKIIQVRSMKIFPKRALRWQVNPSKWKLILDTFISIFKSNPIFFWHLLPSSLVDGSLNVNYWTARNVHQKGETLSNQRRVFTSKEPNGSARSPTSSGFLVLPDVLGIHSSVEVVRHRPSPGSPPYPQSTTTASVVLDSWSLLSSHVRPDQ